MKNQGIHKRLLWAIPSLAIMPLLYGFAVWSWDAVLGTFVLLSVVLIFHFTRWLHALIVLGCSGVFWFEFAKSFLKSYHNHSGIDLYLQIVPAGFVGVIFVILNLAALGAAGRVVMGEHVTGGPQLEPEGTPAGESCMRLDIHPVETGPFDPYEILGLDAPATDNDIREAYRAQMALYHPDKVNHLGAELKAVAQARTLEIQRAFEMLSAA